MPTERHSYNPTYSEVSLQDLLRRIGQLWWLFALSLLLCLGLAYLYAKWAPEVYSVSSSILVELNDNNALSQESKYIEGGIGIDQGDINMYNEQGIIQSKTLIAKAIAEMDLSVGYFQKLPIGTLDYYPCAPITVTIADSNQIIYNTPIQVTPINSDQFQITIKEKGFVLGKPGNDYRQQVKEAINFSGIFSYGELIQHAYFRLIVQQNSDCPMQFPEEGNGSVLFKFNAPGSTTNSFSEKLTVEMPDIQGSILRLRIEDTNVSRSKEFINHLVDHYIDNRTKGQFNLLEEQEQALQNQYDDVSAKLKLSEQELRKFKQNSKSFNIASTSSTVLNQTSILDSDIAEEGINLNKYKGILAEVNRFKLDKDIFSPSTAGINDQILRDEIRELKTLTSERKRIGQYKGPKSLDMQTLNDQIKNLTESIGSMVQNSITNSEKRISNINSRLGKLNSTITRLPGNEQKIVALERDFNLNNNLYRYLDQELSKINITKTSILKNVRIIDRARLDSDDPVAPQKLLIMALGGIMGLLLPMIAVVFLGPKRKETNPEAIAHVTKAVGTPISNQEETTTTRNTDYLKASKEVFSKEQLLRKRYKQIANELRQTNNQVVAITSGEDGVGKSEISLNLASELAQEGYKTLLMDLDLYSAYLSNLLNCQNKHTINDYLHNVDIQIEDVIHRTDNYKSLYHTCAKVNPESALQYFQNSRLDITLSALKFEFDYIIIDTCITDTRYDNFFLCQFIDQAIWVTKASITSNHSISGIQEMKRTLRGAFSILNND